MKRKTSGNGLNPQDLFLYGDDHAHAAEALYKMRAAAYTDSAGYLYLLGAECILKSIILYNNKEVEFTHDIEKLYDDTGVTISDENISAIRILTNLKEIRYPNTTKPTEITSEMIDKIRKFLDELIEKTPNDIKKQQEGPYHRKGGRVLMIKPAKDPT